MLPMPIPSPPPQALKDGGLLQPGAAVLDFGCGTGLLALAVADSVGSLLGVDSSQGMVQVCWLYLITRSWHLGVP